MTMRAAFFTLAAGLLLTGGNAGAQPDQPALASIQEERSLLETAPNFRDIGGYRTKDGHTVKRGVIYRSDQLDRLSDADLARMGELGIRLVVDLRTRTERLREPDRIPDGAGVLVLDVAADASGSLGGDMRKAQSAIATGKGAELLVSANRDFVSLPSARKAYGSLLHRLARSKETVLVYHCTAGKDRTGWATAVILTLLGVPREVVTADYLASNRALARKNAAIMAAIQKANGPLNPALLEPVLTVRPEYLQSAFDEVTRRYGSFDNYLRKGLGVSDAEVAAIRRHLLS